MIKKRYITLSILTICCIGIVACSAIMYFKRHKPIKIGILHSLTGSMAISEMPVVDATMLAIKEINNTGGVMGRMIEPIIANGKSDENIFASEAERLITQEKVTVIFGCWTSPSRKLVKDVVEKHNSLLFYPVQFEGLENSPNIVYTSSTPNQQITPGITWCLQKLGKRFFLVGSDPIIDEIIKDVIYAHDGEVVGQEYIPLNEKNISPVIKKIFDAKPDVILNNIEGETNIAFFNELRKIGITPEKIPTMSFSISEPELQKFDTDAMTGDYASWSYFQSIDRPENVDFVKKIKKEYGENRVTSDAMEAAYFGVYFWKNAVEKEYSTETDIVRKSLKNQAFNAPQGIVHVSEESQHTWQLYRIGKIRSDKQFNVLCSSQKAIRPIPYPASRSKADWDALLIHWYEKWGKKWTSK